MKKNSYHHGNLKAELLSIAFDFIYREDIDKLTLKVLADATNTSRSAIYKHFSSKDELIKEIIKKGFDEFDNAIVPILNDKSQDLKERFFKASYCYINWAKENPNLYRLIFGKKYAYIREAFVTIRSENCKGFIALKALIEEGQKKKIIKSEDSFTQAIVIWASLHGLSSLIIDCFNDVNEIYEDILNQMQSNLLKGLIY
ncbi:MAG: TetR/AcrR family transcriptional regulator [Epsilonproteobacteria bacterium]|nr:TetR/AcrR family transcriptional regulator [Campylobacterota bacterium]